MRPNNELSVHFTVTTKVSATSGQEWASVPTLESGDSWSGVHGRLMAIYRMSRSAAAIALGWERPKNTKQFQSTSTDLAPAWPQLVSNAEALLGFGKDKVHGLFLINHPLLSGVREIIDVQLEGKTGITRTLVMRRLQQLWIHARVSPACPHCMLERPGTQRLEWRFALFPYCLSHQVQLISKCTCSADLVPVDQVLRFPDEKASQRTLDHACKCGTTWRQLVDIPNRVSPESLQVQTELRDRLLAVTDPRDRLEAWTGIVTAVAQTLNEAVNRDARWFSLMKPPSPAEVCQHLESGIETASRWNTRRVTAAAVGMRLVEFERYGQITSKIRLRQDLRLCLRDAYREMAISLPGGVPALFPTSLTKPGLIDPLSQLLEQAAAGDSRGTWLYNASRATMATFIVMLVTGCRVRQALDHLSLPRSLESRIGSLNRHLQQFPDAIEEVVDSVIACTQELAALGIVWKMRAEIASRAPAIRAVQTRTEGDFELARYWLVNEYAGQHIANKRDRYAWTHMCSPEMVRELHADHELHEELEVIHIGIAS